MKTSTKQNLKSEAKGWWPELLVAAALLLLPGTPPVWAGNGPQDGHKLGIVDPNDRYLGQTYGQWAASWWQWVLSIPAAQSPLTDATGEFAGVGQSGPVWFVAGTLGNSVERTVNVPEGKPIFLPVYNWIFGSAVFDCDPTVPGVACDVAELRAKAAAATTAAEVVEAWIDGDQIKHIRNYRALSPEPFSITLPEDSVIGVPAGTYYPQVADGYWLLFTPPEPGSHTIQIHVVNSAFGIDMDLLIHLNVVKPVEVVPPSQRYHGKTYGEWSARWWEWFMEYPVNDAQHPHPGLDPNFDVGAFQDFDDVWFMTAPFGTLDLTLTIPRDKALFFALLNVEVSTLEAPPFYGANAAEQGARAKFFADHILNLSINIDGTGIAPISDFRALSPQFKVNAPTPWFYAATGGKGTSVGDGYYVLLEPLPQGEHNIHVTGAFHFDAGEVPEFGPDPLDILTDTTYHLTVE